MSNSNYAGYMLEMYCLVRYEASKDLSDAIFNNWLVNLTGELGGWIEGDLMQEHYNRWLEAMVKSKGGEFDDKFYRQTLAPNVNHFLRIKEQMESAFGLKPRSKSHTAPHLRNEYQQLLRMYKEDELHSFCSRRSMGHVAINRFARGYEKLENGRMDTFLQQSTAYADMLTDILEERKDCVSSLASESEVEGAPQEMEELLRDAMETAEELLGPEIPVPESDSDDEETSSSRSASRIDHNKRSEISDGDSEDKSGMESDGAYSVMFGNAGGESSDDETSGGDEEEGDAGQRTDESEWSSDEQ